MQKCVKIILTLLTAAALTGCNQAQQSKEAEEQAIRSTVQAYQEAYNEQDAQKLSALWAPNATYINPLTGESAQGREAIEKLFSDKFAQGKKIHVEITTKKIRFPQPNEAIENGVMKVTIGDHPALQVAYELEYIKDNGKWLVNAVHEIELQEAPSHFEKLKELAWLIGKWEDSDDNIEILFDNQWDKYRNFITQHFSMKIYGEDEIEGKQIITWDPAKNRIRSWVFDSDGGFGEGTWEKTEQSWYAAMQYTLSDGRMASSQNIYTPINDHSYTFASVEREVDGEILPDMNPVTVEKME